MNLKMTTFLATALLATALASPAQAATTDAKKMTGWLECYIKVDTRDKKTGKRLPPGEVSIHFEEDLSTFVDGCSPSTPSKTICIKMLDDRTAEVVYQKDNGSSTTATLTGGQRCDVRQRR